MKKNRLVSVALIIGLASATIISCKSGNNSSNQTITTQTSNGESPMVIENVEWETPSEKDSKKAKTTQSIRIGNPELVKYENISVPKDFSYACYPLGDILNDTKTFSFDFDNDGVNENVVIMYSSNKLKVQGNAEKIGFVIMDIEQSDLDEMDPEFIQVSAYDFDDDGMFEMILSVGNGYLENIHVIYSFNPSTKDYYNKAGAFESQQDITLNEDEIEAPYGSQGLFESFRYFKGKVIESNTW